MPSSLDLTNLFAPRSIAVLGASNSAGKPGNAVFGRLASTYRGELIPIHPTETSVCGRAACRQLGQVGRDIDLLVALLPGRELLHALAGAPDGPRIANLLAIPSGFGEVPGEGDSMQKELTARAAARGMRLIGPNSVGLLNACLDLNASLMPELPLGGAGLSCVTQSGGFGMACYMYSHNHRMPFAKFVDVGNTAGLSLHDVVAYFGDDDETRAIGVFVESVGDPAEFRRTVATAARRKPVVVSKAARSALGARASFAHLGLAASGRWEEYGAAGSPILTAESAIEVLHFGKALIMQPPPRGRRIGIVTGSGGVGAELVDFCVDNGLDIPSLSAALRERIKPLLPPYASVVNPVDLTPIWQQYAQLYPPIIRTMLSSGEIDAVIATVIDVPTGLPPLMQALTTLRSDLDKPIYIHWSSPDTNIPNRQVLEGGGVPCFLTTRDTARAVAAACSYGLGGN